jgi:hypothetical protein
MEKSTQTFDQAELELLKEGLRRTYKERFEMATRSTTFYSQVVCGRLVFDF